MANVVVGDSFDVSKSHGQHRLVKSRAWI
jgi:hypothetical protein